MIIAYIALAMLLLGFNLYSYWSWIVKTLTNVVMIFFFGVIYHSWPAVQGWPTERDLPPQFYLHAVNVAEPHRIYLWGTELQHGMSQNEPRAYSLPYTPALHDKVDKASRKLRKGLPVIGEVSNSLGNNTDLGSLEQTRITDQQIVFVDAPQGLVPGKN
ncbi:hypothetical protein [Granulosicoccus antarcticus]|uniref:Uncharacterized protein n=1 Tax=Granulosicoccus antarcticus IMCC3135 TaxID=1192854 RepID=A0A2Z2NG39_9GAMM|nr:hypothetical protein [Granulosicoccus antarcticus]ASJ70212.1 hypothetical protein IMCC3135_00430 [Granulosicoccus antarcticus IMCC3135]